MREYSIRSDKIFERSNKTPVWILSNCNINFIEVSCSSITKNSSQNHFDLQLEDTDQTISSMRQKENLETFLESLLLMDDPGYKSESTHTSLPPMSRFNTTETLNSNLISQEIIEIKTLLVKVKTLLEKVCGWLSDRVEIYDILLGTPGGIEQGKRLWAEPRAKTVRGWNCKNEVFTVRKRPENWTVGENYQGQKRECLHTGEWCQIFHHDQILKTKSSLYPLSSDICKK